MPILTRLKQKMRDSPYAIGMPLSFVPMSCDTCETPAGSRQPGAAWVALFALVSARRAIEVLFLKPRHKKAIILLLYRTDIKVLKDALAHLGPYQTLTSVRYSDPGGENTVLLPATIQI